MITTKKLHPLINKERQRIGELIRIKRIKKGLSMRKLGEKTNVTHTYLYLVEKGERTITKELGEKLSIILDINIYNLWYGETKKSKNFREKIGRIIRNKRKQIGLSPYQLCQQIDTYQSLITKVERGNRNIPLAQINKWHECLDLPLYILRPDFFKKSMC